MSNFRAMNFKIDKDVHQDNLLITTSLKVPRYRDFPRGLGVSGEPGFEGNVIFNDADGLFYGHDGIRWFPFSEGLIEVQDEGAVVDTATGILNFIGDGVTAATGGPGVVNVTIPGGGGGAVTLSNASGTSLVNDGTGPALATKGLTSTDTSVTITDNVTSLDLTVNGGTAADVVLSSAGLGTSLVNDGTGPALATKSLTSTDTSVTITDNVTSLDLTVNGGTAADVVLSNAGGTSLVNDGTGPALATKGLTSTDTSVTITDNVTSLDLTVNGGTAADVVLSSAGLGSSLVNDGTGPALATKSLTSIDTSVTITDNVTSLDLSVTGGGGDVTLSSAASPPGSGDLVVDGTGPDLTIRSITSIANSIAITPNGGGPGTLNIEAAGSAPTLEDAGLGQPGNVEQVPGAPQIGSPYSVKGARNLTVDASPPPVNAVGVLEDIAVSVTNTEFRPLASPAGTINVSLETDGSGNRYVGLDVAATIVEFLVVYVDDAGDDANDVILDPAFSVAGTGWAANVQTELTDKGLDGQQVWTAPITSDPTSAVKTLERAYQIIREKGWNERAYIIVGDSYPVQASPQVVPGQFINMHTGSRGVQRASLTIMGFLSQTASVNTNGGYINARFVDGVNDIGFTADFATNQVLSLAPLQTNESPPPLPIPIIVGGGGNTLTSSINIPLRLDGLAMTAECRSPPDYTANYNGSTVLIKDGVDTYGITDVTNVDYRLNGLYTITDAGSDTTPWVLTRLAGYTVGNSFSADDGIYIQTPSFNVTNVTDIGGGLFELTTSTPHVYSPEDDIHLYIPNYINFGDGQVFSVTGANTFTIEGGGGGPPPPTGATNGLTFIRQNSCIPDSSETNNTNLFIARDNVTIVDATLDVSPPDPSAYSDNIFFRFKGNIDQQIQFTSAGGFSSVARGDVLTFPAEVFPLVPKSRTIVGEVIDANTLNIPLTEEAFEYASRVSGGITLTFFDRTSTIQINRSARLFSGNDHPVKLLDINLELANNTGLVLDEFVNFVSLDSVPLIANNVEIVNSSQKATFLVIYGAPFIASILFGGDSFPVDIAGDGFDFAGIYVNSGLANTAGMEILVNSELTQFNGSVFDGNISMAFGGCNFGVGLSSCYLVNYKSISATQGSTVSMNSCRFVRPDPGQVIDTPFGDDGDEDVELITIGEMSYMDLDDISIRCTTPWVSLETDNRGSNATVIQARDGAFGSMDRVVLYDLAFQDDGGNPVMGNILDITDNSSLNGRSDRNYSLYVQNTLDGVRLGTIRNANLNTDNLVIFDINGPYPTPQFGPDNNELRAMLEISNTRLSTNIVLDVGSGEPVNLETSDGFVTIGNSTGDLGLILNGSNNLSGSPANAINSLALTITDSRLNLHRNGGNNFGGEIQVIPTSNSGGGGVVIGGFTSVGRDNDQFNTEGSLVHVSNSDVSGQYLQGFLPIGSAVLPNNNDGVGIAVTLRSNAHCTDAQNSNLDVIDSSTSPREILQCGSNERGDYESQNDYTQNGPNNCSFN